MKMFGKHFYSILVFVSFSSFHAKAAEPNGCDPNWVPYKDEHCFRLLDSTFRTFDESVKACTALESTLPIIHNSEEQTFLSNYLFKTQKQLDNFWLGAKFLQNSTKWLDSSELEYTNWEVNGNRSKANYCVQMQSEEAELGKWIDEPCDKKNLVVCQKLPNWSIAKLHQLVVSIRKELQNSLSVQKAQLLEETNRKVAEVKQTLIPLGFTYTQLPSDKAPHEIWSWANWTDVSSAYSGVFFRVSGGDSASFGQIQHDSAPRMSRITNSFGEHGPHDEVSLPTDGWSDILYTGSGGSGVTGFLKFYTTGGEVRPRNMAIRVWRRSG